MIYSPKDLSCYWNQAERSPTNTAVLLATKVGQNVIDYATGKELPADKLTVREVHDFKADHVKRNALRIAKLRHAGDWNVAPLAVPNLMDALRKPPLSFDVVVNHKELFPSDPNLIYYPLIYVHGRAALSFGKEDLDALRRHIEPGGGTLFADAACGSAAFDAAFRRFVAELFPAMRTLVPIPKDDDLLSTQGGLRPVGLPVQQGGRRGQGFPPARGGEDRRPLGDHLLEVRHWLRAGAALGSGLQGILLRVGPEDRRQYRHLRHSAVGCGPGWKFAGILLPDCES